MRKRHFVAIALALFLGYFSINFMFPRFSNDSSCDDTVPTTAADSAALADARSRKASLCTASEQRCRFNLVHEPDGSIQVSLDFVRDDFFEGCLVADYQGGDILVYSREGKFVGTEVAPFGLY